VLSRLCDAVLSLRALSKLRFNKETDVNFGWVDLFLCMRLPCEKDTLSFVLLQSLQSGSS
jgi:hypothetical protein